MDVCVCVCDRDDSCLCHVSSMLVSEFEDDLTAISSCSDENDLSKLCQYLTVGHGKVILLLLSIIGITVGCSFHAATQMLQAVWNEDLLLYNWSWCTYLPLATMFLSVSVYASVCLPVCHQDITKSYWPIWTKFLWNDRPSAKDQLIRFLDWSEFVPGYRIDFDFFNIKR